MPDLANATCLDLLDACSALITSPQPQIDTDAMTADEAMARYLIACRLRDHLDRPGTGLCARLYERANRADA